MSEIFFISDTHFNHANILTFTNYDGTPVRPNFKDVQDMNEQMIQNWNSVVKPQDKVYHLGDVAFGNRDGFHKIMPRLMGKKRLIMGNHDKFDVKDYAQYFDKVMSWRQFKDMPKKFIACHYPLHQSALFSDKGTVWCLHGHVHGNNVKRGDSQVDDPMYVNICVEKTNYTPIHINEVMRKMDVV